MDGERLEDLWDFGDPAGSERRFTEHLAQVREVDGEDLAETLTQIARAQGLQHRFEDADRTLDEAEAVVPGDDRRARVRILLERGRVANTAGRAGRGVDAFLAAWDLARAAGEDALAVDAAHMLGIAASGNRTMRARSSPRRAVSSPMRDSAWGSPTGASASCARRRLVTRRASSETHPRHRSHPPRTGADQTLW